jgi:hypothetical protein
MFHHDDTSSGFSMDISSSNSNNVVVRSPNGGIIAGSNVKGAVEAFTFMSRAVWNSQHKITILVANIHFGRGIALTHDGHQIASAYYDALEGHGQILLFHLMGATWCCNAAEFIETNAGGHQHLASNIKGVSLMEDGTHLAAGSIHA